MRRDCKYYKSCGLEFCQSELEQAGIDCPEYMPKMKPILFNTEMVRAILAGRKTETRRVIKVENPDEWDSENDCRNHEWGATVPCYISRIKSTEQIGVLYPKYDVGDVLYVRETWMKWGCEYCEKECYGNCNPAKYAYKATGDWDCDWKWKPSIHMPKKAARIFLRVTNVKVERLQDITYDDCLKEGMWNYGTDVDTLAEFQKLWQSVYKNWSANPWVWVIEFERCEKPEVEE